jgi:hypothetical protein
MLTLIQRIYLVETDIRDGPGDDTVFRRRRQSQPVLNLIKNRLDAWYDDPEILPTSDLGKAIRYAHKRWDGLTHYVELAAAPIDNNETERGMRPNALHRKNALFHASELGAHSYAIIQTLVQSAMKQALEPEAYLNDIVAALHMGADPADLVPIRWASRRITPDVAACS